ncbi:MAG: hypothetical protein GQ564_13005 [Bacteroidales bacterium]|nr:hypothetical protein [Bacteroidales bacterium]
MKKRINFYVTIFLISILLISCEQEEDTSNGYVIVNNVKYKLSWGILENHGKESNYSDFCYVLRLLSTGIDIQEEEGTVESLIGSGHYFSISVFSNLDDKLALGEYVYDENETEKSGTIGHASVRLNFDSYAESEQYFPSQSGSFTVESNDNIYKIEFDFFTDEGVSVTGYYLGKLEFYRYGLD